MSKVDNQQHAYLLATHQVYADAHRVASQAHYDYGKWLIAALVLIHTGTLYMLGTSESFRPHLGKSILWPFVVGLILALLAALAAWFNWGFWRIQMGHDALSAAMLMKGHVPPPNPNPNFISDATWSYRLAIACGIGSIICIPLGAWAISCAVS